jgi:hypothetical protein
LGVSYVLLFFVVVGFCVLVVMAANVVHTAYRAFLKRLAAEVAIKLLEDHGYITTAEALQPADATASAPEKGSR